MIDSMNGKGEKTLAYMFVFASEAVEENLRQIYPKGHYQYIQCNLSFNGILFAFSCDMKWSVV